MRDGIVAFFHRWVPQWSERAELVALIASGDELDVNAVSVYVALMKSESCVRFRPPLRKLPGISGGLCSIETNTIDLLYPATGVDMPRE